jgi:hypothetical protein
LTNIYKQYAKRKISEAVNAHNDYVDQHYGFRADLSMLKVDADRIYAEYLLGNISISDIQVDLETHLKLLTGE